MYLYIISSHSSRVFLNTFYRIDINKENELAEMTLSNRVLSAWVHLSFSCVRSIYLATISVRSSAVKWIIPILNAVLDSKSQNILKNCLKACWTTFSLKVLSTLNFLAYFFSLQLKHENSTSRNCYNKNY